MINLAIPLVNVTQQAAAAVYPHIGNQDKNKADFHATEAMRRELNKASINGTIVIGEGEMDEAPMLFIGENVGDGTGPEIDIAVDPIDGTKLVASGANDSIAVLAAAEKGSLLHAPDMYMDKIAVGPKAKGAIDIELSPEDNIINVAKALGKSAAEVEVMVQERPRHDHIIEAAKKLGAKVTLFKEVDINAALAAALSDHSADLFMGTGGAPEGVVAAVAMRSLGGDFQGKLRPADKEQFDRCISMNIKDPDAFLRLDDIVSTDNCLFAATGITNGLLTKGVEKSGDLLKTQSFLTLNNQAYTIESQHEMKKVLTV
ncbi:class II fructose-bisphosphatase [Alteribacillus sp. YIM 98480]|uniref:class II fructose-bisphosphatase n=1 Tax=Alteribacillus sp. YIM 98480 TaxID=2606599 RepID=UPI00131C018D|nr:class II fructose-bisphosphatase [Alteribacillus sp. YIM 98480]